MYVRVYHGEICHGWVRDLRGSVATGRWSRALRSAGAGETAADLAAMIEWYKQYLVAVWKAYLAGTGATKGFWNGPWVGCPAKTVRWARRAPAQSEGELEPCAFFRDGVHHRGKGVDVAAGNEALGTQPTWRQRILVLRQQLWRVPANGDASVVGMQGAYPNGKQAQGCASTMLRTHPSLPINYIASTRTYAKMV